MRIINKTKKTILAKNIVEAKTWKQKILGLTTRHTPCAMYFHTRFGIHTFGMRYPIDVLILDEHNRIVTIQKHMKPNHIFLWNPKYSRVIELPMHEIDRSKTELGDTITHAV